MVSCPVNLQDYTVKQGHLGGWSDSMQLKDKQADPNGRRTLWANIQNAEGWMGQILPNGARGIVLNINTVLPEGT